MDNVENIDQTKSPKKTRGCLKGCLIFLGIVVIVFVLPFLIFIFWGVPSSFEFHVRDDKGHPIESAQLVFSYDRNINIGGKGESLPKSTTLTTDKNGNAVYSGFVKYRPCIRDVKADGFYKQVYHNIDYPNIILKPKKSPVPMYISRDRAIVFPGTDGNYCFDLLKQDFLPPYGKGIYTDFIFSVKTNKENKNPAETEWDILFSNPNDGIQIVYDMLFVDTYSEFKGPYAAPSDGYVKSYRQAEKNFFKLIPESENVTETRLDAIMKYNHFTIFHKYNPVFCFRIRSNTDQPLYGKIYGNQPCSGQYIRDGKFHLNLQYYLNPDRTRNLEHSYNLWGKRRQFHYVYS